MDVIKIKIILWKLIDLDYIKSNQYKISSYGRIKNIKTGKILKGYSDKDGYIVYGLPDRNGKIKTRKAHRIVADTFIKKDNNEFNIVNHKDGNKKNNYYKNLEWCDIYYNNKHARNTGLNNLQGENNPFSKFTNKEIKKICKLIQKGYTNKEIIELLDINSVSIKAKHALVSSIRHRKAWNSISKKYKW